MDNDKEREAIIKELSENYTYSNTEISKILKDKGFKMNIRILTSQIRYFRWEAIIESIERGGYKLNTQTITHMDNYFKAYPDCWRTLAVRNSFI